MTTWWTYVRAVSGADNQREIADRVGVDPPTITYWRTGNPRPQAAVAFARAYDRHPLEALIAAGLLTDADAAATEIRLLPAGLDEVPTDALLAEIRRRIED